MENIEYREIVINPRVINHLGKDLITTSDVAVTELIKNSLDARASDIRLHIYNNYGHAQDSNALKFAIPEELNVFLEEKEKATSIFVIEDNGKGMNEIQLNKGFLEVGTDIKLKRRWGYSWRKGNWKIGNTKIGNMFVD